MKSDIKSICKKGEQYGSNENERDCEDSWYEG